MTIESVTEPEQGCAPAAARPRGALVGPSTRRVVEAFLRWSMDHQVVPPVPTIHRQTATLRQLVRQATSSVVAGMLGHHAVHAEAVAAQSGGTRKKYAPGDHAR
ncbi:hypothetical protein ACFV06_00990 [Streptomyces sp. NPDC059618]|uniref:hypothetical protein n=1 Tax=Streptomyces sp. NPDC059618 TaxID=3346887 RepID=UPI003694085D